MQGFTGVNGILAVDLIQNTLSSGQLVPTDNLFQADITRTELISIHYVPVAKSDSTGELDFGTTLRRLQEISHRYLLLVLALLVRTVY